LWSPGFPASQAGADGALAEPWGSLCLTIEQPEGMQVTTQRYEEKPVPMAVTAKAAGAVTLTETAYRAPIWPGGVDVIEAVVANTSGESAPVCLEANVTSPAPLNHNVLGLPQGIEPQRDARPWGCKTAATMMSGWATPQGDCDPAFKNIRAGMNGVPIVYRFTVPKGSGRTVVLGFCESFWSMAGQRPLVAYVEGAPRAAVDPLARWGQHHPGCLRFDGRDTNQDGQLEIAVTSEPAAQDKNPILNAIWIFSPDVYVDTNEVLTGHMNPAAEQYVDVGGEKDQSLYADGAVKFVFTLAPGAEQRLTFLVETATGTPVPDSDTSAWTPASLRKAAEDVWRGYDPAQWKE
jgi:hypothetical protein